MRLLIKIVATMIVLGLGGWGANYCIERTSERSLWAYGGWIGIVIILFACYYALKFILVKKPEVVEKAAPIGGNESVSDNAS